MKTKTKLLSFLLLVLCFTQMQGQVTIGSGFEPLGGAILDLKQWQQDNGEANSKIGLMLPRVLLTDLSRLTGGPDGSPVIAGVTNTTPDIEKHIGLTVYNVGNCPGVYVWNGTEWSRMGESGKFTCGAYIADGVWKEFMCYNLGACTSLDPFTPAAGLHGAKYKFGVKDASITMAEDQANPGEISDWTSRPTCGTGTWDESNDPCPEGYRVPTIAEWEAVIDNTLNPQSIPIGSSWEAAPTNFSSGRNFGPKLFLPAAGCRYYDIIDRGKKGHYQSSNYPRQLIFEEVSTSTELLASWQLGSSVRCIKE